MSSKFFSAQVIANFTGGLNKKVETDIINASEATECININLNGKLGLMPREGASIDGSFSYSSDKIISVPRPTFVMKNGLERPVRSTGTILEYRNPYVAIPDWFTLETGFTSEQIFGFANGDAFLYMANGVEVIRRWSGAVGAIDKANTTDTILALTAEGSLTTAALLGFSATGSVIIYADGVSTVKTYTGISGLTLTGLTGLNALTIADDDPVAEAPITTGFTSAPLGNILLIKNSRLLIAGNSSTPTNVYGSKIGNVRDFSYSTPAAADDGFVVSFWGKPITSLGDKGTFVAVFSKNGAKKLSFQQLRGQADNSILTLPTLDSLFEADRLGAVNHKGTLNLDNDVVFTSQEAGLRKISRAEQADFDAPESLIEKIEDDFDTYVVDDSAVGLFKQQLHLALREKSAVPNNNIVILKDTKAGYISTYRGINASDFYTFNNKFYYADSFTKNCWQLYNGFYADFDGTDYFDYLVNWKSKYFSYDYPNHFKEIRRIWIEGFITPNTTIDFKLNFDTENGFQQITKQILGTAGYVAKGVSVALGLKKLGVRGLAASLVDPSLPDGAKPFKMFITDIELTMIKWLKLQYEIETNSGGSFFRITKIMPEIFVLPIEKSYHNSIINNI